MKEVHKVTGGSYGGIFVDEEFESLFKRMFSIPAVTNFRISHPAEWLRLMNDFEMKKRGRRAFEGKDTRITLPRDFIRLASDFTPAGLDVQIYNNEFPCLGPNAMKQLFEPIVSRIVCHMTSLCTSPALQNISCLFMVGGFAESVILQDAIKREFGSRFKILILTMQVLRWCKVQPSLVRRQALSVQESWQQRTVFEQTRSLILRCIRWIKRSLSMERLNVKISLEL